MPTLTPEKRAELEARLHEVQTKDREQYDELRQDAQAIYRAVEWHLVDGPEGWVETCEKALTQHRSGRFPVERLGAERP